MRFMVIMKANAESEAGIMPSTSLLEKMGRFNNELAEAGVLLGAEGLHPSSKGFRVKFSGDRRIVTDGPFTETKDLIAGFWLWKVASREEALAWLQRLPDPDPGVEGEIEIREVFEAEDFGPQFTDALREAEERTREHIARYGRPATADR